MLVYIYAAVLLLLLLIITLGFLFITSGLVSPVEVQLQTPPYLSNGALFAYKFHTGQLDDAGYLFTETHSLAPNCIQCGIKYGGEFLNERVCKYSVVGALLTEDPDCRQVLEKAGYQFAQLPPVREALVASFPHVSFLSILIGSKRVYRHLNSHISECQLKVNTFLEIYDDRWIHYVGLLTDGEKFIFIPDRESVPLPPSPESETPAPEDVTETLKSTVNFPDESNALPADGRQNECHKEKCTDDSDESVDATELEASFEKITDISGIPVGK